MTRTAFALRNPALTPTADPVMMQVASHIARFGLHVVHVGEGCDCGGQHDGPLPPEERFGYTIGLTELGHAELLVRGLGARETAELLTRWGDAVLDGLIFDAGHLLCEGSGGPTWELIPVRRPTQTLRWAGRYYRGAGVGLVDALELIPARRPCPCEVCS